MENSNIGQRYGHIHEISGTSQIAQRIAPKRGLFHNHRYSGMTGEPICAERFPRRHYHNFALTTDFFTHHHEMCGETSLDIPVGQDRHVHFAFGETSVDDCHLHIFLFATHIENYLGAEQ